MKVIVFSTTLFLLHLVCCMLNTINFDVSSEVNYMEDNLTISCKPDSTLNMEIYFIKIMKKKGDILTDIVTKHTHNFQLIPQWHDEDIRVRSHFDFSDKSEKSLIYEIPREHVKKYDAGLYSCYISGRIGDNVATIDEVKEIQILFFETTTEGITQPKASSQGTIKTDTSAQETTTQKALTQGVTSNPIPTRGIETQTVTEGATQKVDTITKVFETTTEGNTPPKASSQETIKTDTSAQVTTTQDATIEKTTIQKASTKGVTSNPIQTKGVETQNTVTERATKKVDTITKVFETTTEGITPPEASSQETIKTDNSAQATTTQDATIQMKTTQKASTQGLTSNDVPTKGVETENTATEGATKKVDRITKVFETTTEGITKSKSSSQETIKTDTLAQETTTQDATIQKTTTQKASILGLTSNDVPTKGVETENTATERATKKVDRITKVLETTTEGITPPKASSQESIKRDTSAQVTTTQDATIEKTTTQKASIQGVTPNDVSTKGVETENTATEGATRKYDTITKATQTEGVKPPEATTKQYSLTKETTTQEATAQKTQNATAPGDSPMGVTQKVSMNTTHKLERDNIPLQVGLGIGIPLFFIVLPLIIVLCVYNSKRHKSNSLDDDDLDRTMPAHEGFFSGAIPGRFNSWNRPGDCAFHGRWDDESVDSERGAYDNESFRGKDPYVYDNNKGGKPATFSWDFIFQSLPGNGQYHIKRPETNLKPNPGFSKKGGGPSTNA